MKTKTFKEKEKEKIAKANQIWLNKKSISVKKIKHIWNAKPECRPSLIDIEDNFNDLIYYKS